ncbi:type II toxin-antitoxin system HigB family toxin [Klebsiella michiganensis]|nr:type II toxin-antitoxin system HigB family toxin [Klebsiella michiganensis]
MHLISMKAIGEAVNRFPQHKKELLDLAKTIEKANCKSPDALRMLFPSLDNFKYLDKHYVIDVAHNRLRVIALIFFESQKFYLREIFTHAEYDRYVAGHTKKGKK